MAEIQNNLREALIATLNSTMSSDAGVRKTAEEQITILEVTEEFGVHLVELILNNNGPLPIRQLASVLLKQYIESHWTAECEKFRLPECPAPSKCKIREMLTHGLYEPISKVRSSIAYAISAIANWDWPENWPNLFDLLMNALKSGDENAVHGAMRVLTEFSRDLSDQHIPQVAPVILPEMYRIFCDENKYSIRTRARAVEIFTIITTHICTMSEVHRSLPKNIIYPVLPHFTQALVKDLQTPDSSFTTDSGLKKDILHALTVLLKTLPKQMGQYIGEILGPVWHTLTTSASSYVNATVYAREASSDPTDSDGEVLNIESLITTIFEFVLALLEAAKHKDMIRQGSPDLIFYLLLYMQITEEQINNWSSNPDAFVEDEDEDSFAYSVRISSQDLLKSLSEELSDAAGSGLVVAVNRLLERCNGQRNNGDPMWWKGYEAIMLALGVTRDLILDQTSKGKLSFDVSQFIESVVLGNLDPNLSPFLSGRALWCCSRYAQVLNDDQLKRSLEATVSALTQSQVSIIRISAVRSIWGFCEYLKSCDRQTVLANYLPAILDGLISLASQASSEVLSLILETFCIVVSVDANFTVANASRISTLCIAVFIKANNDPVLVQLVQHVVRELCTNPGCTQTVQMKFIPTLTSILNTTTDKVPPAMQAVALDMLEVMVRSSVPPLEDSLMTVAFPAVAKLTLNTDDLSTLQNGGECMRAYVSMSPEQVLHYRDSEGRSGLQYVIEVASHLLAPSSNDGTAVFVGKLITALLRKMSDHLGNSLDQLLRGTLSKMQGTDSLSITQSLVLVYAQLIHHQIEAVLNFLGSVPGPQGQSALAFVLTLWCSKQHLFYGNYERKVTSTALARLLEHSITTNDTRLQEIVVQGDQIINMEDKRIMTRSRKQHEPDQWTKVPVIVKLFKLIIYELSNVIEANLGKDDVNESDEEDEEEEGWEDAEENGVNGHDTLGFIGPSDLDGDLAEEDEDPDVVADPLYKIELQQYLTNFIITFARHPAYSAFVPHLNPHEKEVLQGIGL